MNNDHISYTLSLCSAKSRILNVECDESKGCISLLELLDIDRSLKNISFRRITFYIIDAFSSNVYIHTFPK